MCICSSNCCSCTAGMLVRFFFLLRSAGIPVSITELLTLLEALQAGLGDLSAERFYTLARTCLVKDERFYDPLRQGVRGAHQGCGGPLRACCRRSCRRSGWPNSPCATSPMPRRPRSSALGGWEQLMQTLAKRLEEQKERHQGGNKWIGTAGTLAVRRLRLQSGRGARGARRAAATAAPSRSGPARIRPISTTRSNSAPATSRWRCANCGRFARRGRARRAGARGHHRRHGAVGRLARHQDAG